MIDYNDKIFCVVQNSDGGEVSAGMRFHYKQSGNIVYCIYVSDEIQIGHLLGKVNEDHSLDFRYQQLNTKAELRTGVCHSTPEILPSGKIRLHEKWRWTSGDCSEGESVLEEV